MSATPFDAEERAIQARWASKCVAGECPFAHAKDVDHARTILRYEATLRAATVSAGRLREAELRTAATSALLAVRHAYRMARKDNADAATMPTEQALAICERLRAALSAEEG